jgi:hypothetical protein
MSKATQLEALFANEQEIVDGLLLERIEPLLSLSRGSDRVMAKPELLGLPNQKKILAYLLARHAMVRLGVPGVGLEADAQKISENLMIPIQRTREELSRMKTSGILEKGEHGYSVPVANLLVALDQLSEAKRSAK